MSSADTKERCGAVIEIGSGSVSAAIAISSQDKKHPTVVWSKREFALLGAEYDFSRSLKSLLTTFLNVFMALERDGLTALRAVRPHATCSHIQLSISAPWAYTISKIIEYQHDTPFTVTDELIERLATMATDRTLEVLKEAESRTNSPLSIMTRALTDITVNGYHTMSPVGQLGETVSVTQVSAVAESLIIDAVNDLRLKILPRAVLERYSTMLIYHCLVRELYSSMTEFCLVDLTYEATEIAIVRDGVLQYSTHTSIGQNTLVRNFALRRNIPEGDARTKLRTLYEADSISGFSQEDKNAIEALFTEYREALTQLFNETGDSLSIPKVLFFHCGLTQERYFDDHILEAAKAATNSLHTLHNVSYDIVNNLYTESELNELKAHETDTATLMAVQFFHKQHHCSDFTQL